MKICSNCKTLNNDSASFCQSCGSSSFEPYIPQEQELAKKEQLTNSSGAVIDTVKNMFSGTLFIVMIILFAITTAMSFYSDLTTISSLNEAGEILSNKGIADSKQLISFYKIFMFCVSVSLVAIKFFAFSGMLKLRKSSGMYSNGSFDLRGFKTIRTSTLICIAYYFISTAGIIVLYSYTVKIISRSIDTSTNSLESMINIYSSFTASNSLGYVIIALIITLVIMTIYLLKIIQTVNSISLTAKTGVPSDKASIYVVVINFILAFFMIFRLLSGGIFGFLYYGMNIAFFVIFSIFLLQYRSDMLNYMNFYPLESNGSEIAPESNNINT